MASSLTPRSVLGWWRDAGPGEAIFRLRPFVPGTNIFPTAQGGYGITFAVSGVDPDGASRRTQLDPLSRDYADAVASLPERCLVYQYLVSRKRQPLDAPKAGDPLLASHQRDREDFLNETARFKDIRLYQTLYLPGPAEDKPVPYSRAKQKQLRALRNGAALFARLLSRLCPVRPMTAKETTSFYSYLRSFEEQYVLEEPLTSEDFAQKLSPCAPKFSADNEFLKLKDRYVQMASLFQRPKGTRPALWYDLLKLPGEFVACAILEREESSKVSAEIATQEAQNGVNAQSLTSVAMEVCFPQTSRQPATRSASQFAQEDQAKSLGGALSKLHRGQLFGWYHLYLLLHSRDRHEVEETLTQAAGAIKQNGAGLLEKEEDGLLAAYLAIFPGNRSVAKRDVPMELNRMADLAFLYKPHGGIPQNKVLRARYTYMLETPEGTEFPWSTFPRAAAHTLFVADSGAGKSLLNNELVIHEAAHGGFLLVIDMADSYSFAVRSIGGAASVVTPQSPKMAPFRLPYSPESVSLIAGLVEGMIRVSGVILQAGDETIVQQNVEKVYRVPESERRLGLLGFWLPERLRPGLANWIRGHRDGQPNGRYAEMWDNVDDEFSLNPRQSVDYSRIKEDRYRDLVQIHTYWTFGLFRRRMDDPQYWHIPKTVVAEEIWSRVEDKQLMEQILRVPNSDRKNLGRLVVITPKLAGLGPHARMIRSVCPVTFFGAGDFDEVQYRDFYGMNTAKILMLRKLKAREWCIQVDGEQGFFKRVVVNVDDGAYARATTDPQEKAERWRLIEQYGEKEGMKRFTELIRERRKVA